MIAQNNHNYMSRPSLLPSHRVAELLATWVQQLLQDRLPSPEVLVPDQLHSILETVEHLPYLEGPTSDVVPDVLGAHKSQKTRTNP